MHVLIVILAKRTAHFLEIVESNALPRELSLGIVVLCYLFFGGNRLAITLRYVWYYQDPKDQLLLDLASWKGPETPK